MDGTDTTGTIETTDGDGSGTARQFGATRAPAAPGTPSLGDEGGSVVSEYGLVAVLGATIAGLAISWAKGGAVASLLAAVLRSLQTVIAA